MLIDKKNLHFYKINYTDHDGTLSFEVRKNCSIVSQLLYKYNIPTRGKKILDFGFGTGNMLALLHRMGSVCYGAEILPEVVNRLAKHKKYDLRLITTNRLPFDDNMFDIIVASESIEHVPDERLILFEIARVLKPSGFFIMGVPSNGTDDNFLHFREYTSQDIERLEYSLKARCVGYRGYGGKLFNKTYDYLNQIISRCMGVPVPDTEEYRIQRITKKYSLFLRFIRYIYHKVFVQILIIFYLLDGKYSRKINKDIWFIFKLC